MMHPSREPGHAENRRGFIRESSWLLAGAVPVGLVASPHPAPLPPQPQGELRLGLVGCGFRGIALAAQAMRSAAANVRLCTVADVFEDRIQQACRTLKGNSPEHFSVEGTHRFAGLDACRRLLNSGIDLVILATPPSFRPSHFREAIEAGKHVFAEKPVAVDLSGVQIVLESCRLAAERGLSVAAGFQRRHAPGYLETVARVRAGAIGDIHYARSLSIRPTPRNRPRQAGQSELEYQIRNWQHFNWLSGDSIVEQQVHSLDLMNWVLDGHPLEAQGVGGWKNSPPRDSGPSAVFDHHSLQFTYRNDVRLMSMNAWSDAGRSECSEWIHGSQGACDLGNCRIYDGNRQLVWQAEPAADGCQASLDAFLAHIIAGGLFSEGVCAAESTMTAIMGRMATYSGDRICWRDFAGGNHRLADPARLASLKDLPPAVTRV